MKPIVVVGSINMDLVSRAERIPGPGETLLGSNFQWHPGGKGANQAVAVAKLGYPSIFLGKTGEDLFGSQLQTTLKKYGVDINEMETVEGSSGTASIVVDAKGENSIIVTPAANRQVTPDYLLRKLHILRQAGMVLAQLEIPLETICKLAEICDEFGIPLVLDPAPARQLDTITLSRIHWFTPNQTEAQFYCGSCQTTEDMLANLFSQGIRNVILKQGAEGVLLARQDGTRHLIEAFPVKAIDTTAAGDAFNGAFAVAMMSGRSALESIRYAAAAAAISVTREGAQPSLADGVEVENLLTLSSSASPGS